MTSDGERVRVEASRETVWSQFVRRRHVGSCVDEVEGDLPEEHAFLARLSQATEYLHVELPAGVELEVWGEPSARGGVARVAASYVWARDDDGRCRSSTSRSPRCLSSHGGGDVRVVRWHRRAQRMLGERGISRGTHRELGGAMSARAFVLVAVFLSAACGGHLDTDSQDGGSTCPNQAAGACSDEGETCSQKATECGQVTDETCTCMNGAWVCPVFECPEETCPIPSATRPVVLHERHVVPVEHRLAVLRRDGHVLLRREPVRLPDPRLPAAAMSASRSNRRRTRVQSPAGRAVRERRKRLLLRRHLGMRRRRRRPARQRSARRRRHRRERVRLIRARPLARERAQREPASAREGD